MPGGDYNSFADGSHVIEKRQHNRIQFNNLSILPNAEMADPEYRRRYGLTTVTSKIINIHGTIDVADDDIQEYQELVVATATMPPEQWRRTRAFCWMTALFHFDKMLQIPLILIHEVAGVSYRDLIEAFSEGVLAEFPTLQYIQRFFQDKAADIQQGGEEYCRSERWLNIYWPADELVLIHLCTGGKLGQFYEEAEEYLAEWLVRRGTDLAPELLAEALFLNSRLVKLPFQQDDQELRLEHNLWEFYRAALEGRKLPLESSIRSYHVDRTSRRFDSWEEWCQQVIWYGNKKGAYLYSQQVAQPQLAGHY